MATGDRPDVEPRRYAIPFERIWSAARTALEEEGAIDHADDTGGVLRASGETGFPRQRWSCEVRVRLDAEGQTALDLTVHLLEGLDFGRTRRRARRLLAAIDRHAGADGSTRLPPGPLAVLFALGALAACGTEPPPPEPAVEAVEAPVEAEVAPAPERTYDRAFAFVAADTDSSLAVVWLFSNDDYGGSVDRSARGLLLRGGVWDDFFEALSTDPASESPWRIAPSGPLRLVVGTGDRVDAVIYEQGERLLELELRGGGAVWTGADGGSFGIEDASIVLGDRAVPGRAVDLSRAHRPGEAVPGDWVFLTSGDSISIVAQAPRSPGDGSGQGWVLRGDSEILLPTLTFAPTGTRAYDEARRDVPIAWSLADPDGELAGSLQVRAASLRPGEGEGPLLPVDGVFEVTGVVTLGGAERRVEGILRHRQEGTD